MEYKRLGDIATYINGYAFKPEQWSNKGKPIIRIQNLNNKDAEYNYFDGEIDEKYLIKKGDVLISWSASIGIYEWDLEDAYLNQHIFKVVFEKEEIDKKYFKFMVDIALNKAVKYMHGSTMKHITKKYFDNILVPVPSLDKQKKIAEVLDKAQFLIDKKKEQIGLLDELVKSRFIEMFGDINKNNKIWDVKILSELIDVIGGYAFKSTEFVGKGIPVLKIGNINAGYFKNTNLMFWNEEEKLERYLIRPGDLVISLTGTVGKDDYGNVCIMGKDYDKYYLNQRNAKLDIRDENILSKLYLTYALKVPEIKKRLTGISRGVRQANISNKDIQNLELPIPPIELQNEFAEFVAQTDSIRSKMEASLSELEDNFNSLMQKAFKGELF